MPDQGRTVRLPPRASAQSDEQEKAWLRADSENESDARVAVAALFVDPKGVYAGLPDVEVWDEGWDARLYGGPHPVVAHPPCKVWSLMGNCRPELRKGEDGGCFEAALHAVRTYGGVLEHPVYTRAWRAFELHPPMRDGWNTSLFDAGLTAEVDQAWYGHPCNKRTWLYYIGDNPPQLQWGLAPFTGRTVRNDGGGGRDQRSRTPEAFRDVLLAMARTAHPARSLSGCATKGESE